MFFCSFDTEIHLWYRVVNQDPQSLIRYWGVCTVCMDMCIWTQEQSNWDSKPRPCWSLHSSSVISIEGSCTQPLFKYTKIKSIYAYAMLLWLIKKYVSDYLFLPSKLKNCFLMVLLGCSVQFTLNSELAWRFH